MVFLIKFKYFVYIYQIGIEKIFNSYGKNIFIMFYKQITLEKKCI